MQDDNYYAYIKKFFGKAAFIYDYLVFGLSRLRSKVADLANIEPDFKVLDVCTGTGQQAFAFAKKGCKVVAIDLLEDMLKIARKHNAYKNLEFRVADATNMPFSDSEFDISCASFGLHDMPLDIREKTLKEMTRVTKPKGTIIIIDYALPENKIKKSIIYYLIKSYETKYYPEYIRSGLTKLIRQSGIEIERELFVYFGAVKILKCLNR